ncbi:hypothetical protein [Nostoc sp. JL33]|uniref:hypothetical protein n=1 Tax=Nostoc sp. JL33 TaxID=2815396 RepID=UPI0025E36E51|nr:hypothetical protein [Nostoc sp. JL33]MBN3873204.1 hypothetical protein [Nostoc sp. JL33]
MRRFYLEWQIAQAPSGKSNLDTEISQTLSAESNLSTLAQGFPLVSGFLLGCSSYEVQRSSSEGEVSGFLLGCSSSEVGMSSYEVQLSSYESET